MHRRGSASAGSQPAASSLRTDSRIHAIDRPALSRRRAHRPSRCRRGGMKLSWTLLEVAVHKAFVAEHRFSNAIRNRGAELWRVRYERVELAALATGIRCRGKIREQSFVEGAAGERGIELGRVD